METSDQQHPPELTAFLASAIHDMKNSISMLVNFMEDKLSEPEVKDHPICKQMAPMLYEVKRVNSNLIQLLTLYKVDKKFYPFDLTENSLDEFLTEIEQQNRALMDTQGVQLEMDIPDDLYWYFDRELVAGVLNHALNNATRYTRDKLRLAAAEVDGQLEFRVEDNGGGYPPTMLEEGINVNRGVSFNTGSTGLGLYFSSVVAKMHKNQGRAGEILLENGGKFGGGCFVLRLP